MDTWLLLTAYRKFSAPYPMVPLSNPYDLPFSYNMIGILVRYDPLKSSKVIDFYVI